jgi:hypothetical protein
MATLSTTTAKTDNIDGSVKEAYKNPKPAGIIHCPMCSGTGSLHTAVCEYCEGDGHVKSLSVEETNKAEQKAAKTKLEEDIKNMEKDSGFEAVREMTGEDKRSIEESKKEGKEGKGK